MKSNVLSTSKLDYADGTTGKISVIDRGPDEFSHQYCFVVESETLNAGGWPEAQQRLSLSVDKDYLRKIREVIEKALSKMAETA